MSADIFRTSQLIIIMLNQKHSYLTFNKGGSKKMSLEFEPLLPCRSKPQTVHDYLRFFFLLPLPFIRIAIFILISY